MKKSFVCIAILLSATFAQAQVMHFLVSQWVENGNRFCKYDNGTVLNVGINLCALSI